MTKRTDAPQTPARPVTTAAGDPPMPRRRPESDGVVPPTTAGSEPGPTTFVDPVAIPIQKATDLGSVQVLKHGNYYLLTDPFGDIHPDSRGLGLYDSDSRLVSCLSLRVGGVRPVLLHLQGAMALATKAMTLRADFDWPKPDRRREFLRVRLNGQGALELFPNQSSGVLTSTVWGDGVVDNPPGQTIRAGDTVNFIPLASLLA